MDNLMTLALEAHSDEQNHHRRYEIVVGRDLFDDWTVSVRYGRVGRGGQKQRYSSNEETEIRAIIRDKLRRRVSAPTRIGCPYRLVKLSAASEMKAEAWLPGDVVARFLMTV